MDVNSEYFAQTEKAANPTNRVLGDLLRNDYIFKRL